MYKLIVKLFVVIVVISSVIVIWNRFQLDFEALVRINPVPHAKKLVKKKQYSSANEYLSYFMEYDYVKNDKDAVKLFNDIGKIRGSYSYQTKKAFEGLLYGKSDEMTGKAVALATDFLVIGDIRDLSIESVKWYKGESPDKLVAALSTIGLVASAATFMSAGSTAPAKGSISFFKISHSMGKLPKWLVKNLIASAKAVKKTKKLDNLTGLFRNTYGIVRHAGLKGGMELISISKKSDDLLDLLRFGKQFGKKTNVLMQIGGDTAIKSFRKMKNVDTKSFLLASTYGKKGIQLLEKAGPTKFLSKIKYGSRLTKAIWPKRLFFNTLKYTLGMLPTWFLFMIVILGPVVVVKS